MRQCATHTYDAIFMDIQLPDIDGYHLTQALREKYPHLIDTPVIAITASSDSENERRCKSAGITAIVCKPIRAEYLAETLLQALNLPKS
ncbi:MAG: response regulator [Planctomycetota bacterium]|nr:MAG: response regulator [Planctomycetota bacterium]